MSHDLRPQPYAFSEQALASSPIFKDGENSPVRKSDLSDRTSITSSLRLSRDLLDLRWEDSGVSQDDSLFLDEDQVSVEACEIQENRDRKKQEQGRLPAIPIGEAPNAYSALSMRADSILANAKKQLTLLEGNLKGARHSLLVSPPTLAALRKDLHISSTGVVLGGSFSEIDKSRVLLRPYASTTPLQHTRSLTSLRSYQPSHSRMLSDSSVPVVRKSSIKRYRSPDYRRSRELSAQRPLHRPLLEPRLGIDKQPSVEHTVSVTPTKELRNQAEALRNRLSYIQSLARNDAQPRESTHDVDQSPVSDQKALSEQLLSVEQSLDLEEEIINQLEHTPSPFLRHNRQDRLAEWHQVLSANVRRSQDRNMDENESDGEDDLDFRTAHEEFESDEDAPPPDEPHENRADAFDYQHFILHSGMGNAIPGKRSTSDSSSSTSTTRAMAPHDDIRGRSLDVGFDTNSHRSVSKRSVMSFQSFATAAESSEADAASDGSDDAHEGLMHDDMERAWPMPPSRSTSALGGLDVPTPTENTFQHKAFEGRVSAVYWALVGAEARTSAGLSLTEQDDALVYSVAERLREVCRNLQDCKGAMKMAGIYRSRLEEVRRVLDGEARAIIFE